MRFLALCCDYDGTLALHGVVDDSTVGALQRVIESGRRLVMVTGRELDDLQRVFPRLDLFERVVAENGALLNMPATREEKLLTEPASPALAALLRERGVQPLSVGRGIVATWTPHEDTVLHAIRELGLELQVIFNKGAVMVLPSGTNKASGLSAALDSMGLSPHNAIGIGDAENDHAFLGLCECSVAVANALPALKDAADIVTAGDHGAGVVELIESLLADDLASHPGALARHRIALGTDAGGREVGIAPHGAGVLMVGTSGSGKSTVATGLIERLVELRYSFCVIDPEGDYEAQPDSVSLGTPERAPSLDEALQLLEKGDNAVINLVGLPLADRPTFFLSFLPRLQSLRARTGKPHWLFVDEAHHLLPAAWQPSQLALPERLDNVVLISVHPDLIAPRALAGIHTVITIGADPAAQLRQFAASVQAEIDARDDVTLEHGEALVWQREQGPRPQVLKLVPSRAEHRRHSRKYAEGELPADRSFWFRGPHDALNLRAQNLVVFLQMADGVDDATWLHHLRRGDYSRWFEEGIKDEGLAQEARRIEAMSSVSAAQGRSLMRGAIERIYTLPA
jgi:hydroxymethylpyrimidine pyrophosphatase-like HAD family hydrolase